MILRSFGFLLTLSWCSSRALAAFENLVTVVQPVEVDGPGVMVAMVTYIGYDIDWQDPSSEIMLATQPNLISCDGKSQDRNSAVRAGIRFVRRDGSPTPFPPGTRKDVRGDTLDVVVDLSTFKTTPGISDEWDRMFVTTTLACGLRNARSRWPTIRYVKYDIEGNQAFSSYSGVYSLERVQPPEGPDQPDPKNVGPTWLRR